ncbi:Kef-type K+ transport systems membrane component [Gaiella occulta]|uniref:Kef-type K+ transport systems membrane component n=1 Tax=Gaiella occulta TaxID=1002870 RepID=A0A7M2YYL5_9ACTN|nr:cation:proton antiporter [Gaiella occulta]RDI74968.1 Kef-type K+ transport systems membrane component [Gaiella occulta]
MTELPLAAGGAAAQALVDLFVVLLAAKLGDELFKRLGQPAIVGEILAGVLVGPAVLGLVDLTAALEVFAELGVVFLLFWVGLETRVTELRAVGSSAFLVGVLGVVLPFAGGFGLGLALGESGSTSAFLGAALVATSVGITSAVLVEIGALASRAGRTIIGAAIVDDIIAMLILAVAVGVAAGGTDLVGLAVVVALALGFVAFFALGGTALMRRRPGMLAAPRFSESPLLPAVILCLGLAALAAEIGLAAIIGAFLAGMMVAETTEQHPIEEEVAPLYAFFPPFFFASIGMQIDLGALVDAGTLALLVAVTALAAATKFLGAWLGARGLDEAEARFVGAGMVPRGEVGIIVAGIARASGVIGEEMFAVVVGMSVLTTLAVPPVLRVLGKRLPVQDAAPQPS